MTGIELEAALTAFPRSRLCDFATPVHHLPRLERKLNTCPLYIKRDDLNGVGSGGNKVRPLEYLLGEAQAQGCDVVIASGQENSNLCSIAASACCRLGIKCILVHNNDQPTHLAGNILLNKLSGVEEHYVGTIPETERNDYVAALAERLRQEGKKPAGVQIHDLFVPGGNGGMAAGIVYGTALLGAPFHVHVVSVENTKEELESILDELFRGLERYTGLTPPVPISSVMTVHGQYRGDGWGIPTEQSDAMIEQMAQLEGVLLERIYTAKTAWGMCDLLRRGEVKSDGACLVHSGGFASLFYQYG